jgi:hypothetical protein
MTPSPLLLGLPPSLTSNHVGSLPLACCPQQVGSCQKRGSRQCVEKAAPHCLLPAVPSRLPRSRMQEISLGTFTPDCVLIAWSPASPSTSKLRDKVTLPHNSTHVQIGERGRGSWSLRIDRDGP